VARLRVTVPHSLAIPAAARHDMLAIVPSSLAKELTRGGDLLLRQPPYRAGTATTRAIWHGATTTIRRTCGCASASRRAPRAAPAA
jgi:DNA-binding transcriptional LysR family regulator